jgi:hypothetical protein
MGIEPTSSAWKAEVIPLYDTRLKHYYNSLPGLYKYGEREIYSWHPAFHPLGRYKKRNVKNCSRQFPRTSNGSNPPLKHWKDLPNHLHTSMYMQIHNNGGGGRIRTSEG